MRKKQAEKRDVLADPIYSSKMVTKLINGIMRDGKKGTAQRILYDAFNIVKDQYLDAPEHWIFITIVLVTSLFLQLKKDVNPIYLTIAAGVAGALIYFIA